MPHLTDLNGAPMDWATLHARVEAYYEARELARQMASDHIIRYGDRERAQRDLYEWLLNGEVESELTFKRIA